MPTSAEHRAKAESNEFFIQHLNNPFWDWFVSVAFYTALQYIDAYFATLMPPVHPPTHQTRDSHIHAKLPRVYVDYRQLEDDSRDARYDASMQFTQTDADRARVYLNRIKAEVIPLLP